MLIEKLRFAVVIGVFILGLILRIYNLDKNPPGFFCDEAAIGYDAYKILQTGKDQYGVPFPIFFRSLEDYKSPLAIYSTIPFISFFGLTEISVRLQSVFYGMIVLILLYLIGKEIITPSFGIWTMFVGAITPWLVHYNRVGFEYNVYIAFFLLAIYLFLKSTKNKSYIIPALVTSGLTLYTYQPAKMLGPLLLSGILVLYRRTFTTNKKESVSGLILFFIISLPLLLSLHSGEAFTRFNLVSVFSVKEPLHQALENYFIQLAPSYFFIKGEPTFITRHFTEGLTPLLVATSPFLLLGLFSLIKNVKQKYSQLLLFWLLIYPIAGAVTATGPFTGRSFIGAPLMALVSGVGVYEVTEYFRKKVKNLIIIYLLQASIVSSLLINLAVFVNFYFNKYPLYSADFEGWQYGAREIVTFFTQTEDDFDELIMQPDFNSPEIFLKFYAPNSCRKCLIGNISNFQTDKKQLFALTPSETNKVHVKRIYKTIYYPNQKPGFNLIEIDSIKE